MNLKDCVNIKEGARVEVIHSKWSPTIPKRTKGSVTENNTTGSYVKVTFDNGVREVLEYKYFDETSPSHMINVLASPVTSYILIEENSGRNLITRTIPANEYDSKKHKRFTF